MAASSSPLSSLSSLTPSPVPLEPALPPARSPSPPPRHVLREFEPAPVDKHRDKRFKYSNALLPTESEPLLLLSTPLHQPAPIIPSTAPTAAFRPLPTSSLSISATPLLADVPTPASQPTPRTAHGYTLQEMNALLQDLPDDQFDHLPSSDPQPSSLHHRAHPKDRHFNTDDAEDTEEQQVDSEKNATEIHNDSGFFLPADLSFANNSKRDAVTIAASGAEELVEEIIIEDDDEDFEGDDMWIGYSEPEAPINSEDFPTSSTTVLACDLLPISTFPTKIPFPTSTAVSDDESDYDRDWDNGPAPTFGGMDMMGFGGGGGFTTGGGKKVAPPSEAAILRSAAALAREASPPSDHVAASTQPRASTSKSTNKFSLPPPPPAPSAQFSRPSVGPSVMPTTGFASARGGAIYAPSEAATERAARLLLSSPPALLRTGSRNAPTAAPVAFSGFTSAFVVASNIGDQAENAEGDVFDADEESGRGTLFGPKPKVVGEGREPLVRMDDNSQRVDTPTRRTRTESSSPLPLPPPATTMTTKVAPTKTPAAPRFHAPTHSTPNGNAIASRAPTTVSRTPLASTSKIPIRPPSTLRSSIPGFRPPLLQSTSKPSPATTVMKATPFKPAPALRRLNISMTPRPRSTHKHKFSSPFRGGVRPEGLTSTGIVSKEAAEEEVVREKSAKGKGKQIAGDALADSVFDLRAHGERLRMVEYGIVPQGSYFEKLQAAGLPLDLLSLDATTSQQFIFPCGRGTNEAYARLIEVGCTFMTDAWVENHWSLIVWKLASLVRSKPDELETMWKWEYAMDQLFYRYEREINLAQRSSIKRIQEQDSSASSPLVLCVTAIRWAEPPEAREMNPDEEPLMVISGLELTDGWYRIRANIDITLKNAAERGRIAVGCKLAISGARLDGAREANDVLEALTKSSLVLTGNSCALAPWYATLGFVKETFIASLESLTHTGGVAPLLDIVITRLYGTGYVDTKSRKTEVWNAEEEREKAEQWINGREKAQARLAEQMEKSREDSLVLRNLLEDAVQRFEPAGNGRTSPESTSQEAADEILERIEATTNKRSIIRKLSSRQARECLSLVDQNTVNSQQQAMADFDSELRVAFPPRDVRGFRVVRIKDAAVDRKKPSIRDALLTIWDADSLGSDFLVEGKRYLLSNVVPKGSWKRKSTEIALATRRDSRWRSVDR